MKVVEILGGFRLPISNEENRIYEALAKGPLLFEKLSDRDKQLANDLYFRNIVNITEEGIVSRNDIQSIADIDW